MRNHIALTLCLGTISLIAAIPATAKSTVPESSANLCLDTLSGLDCAQTHVGAARIKWHPGHYVMADIRAVLDQEHFEGAKVSYYWRDLEPERGQYDFSEIERDLQKLARYDKRLVIQVGIKAFNVKANNHSCAPEYVWDAGGVHAVKYEDISRFDGAGKTGLNRCMAKITESRVAERIAALAAALGERFNDEPYFEAVVLPETAGSSGEDASVDQYVDALKYLQEAFKAAFPNTVVLQSSNWVPEGAEMEPIMHHAYNLGVGVSGPDLMPERATESSIHYPTYHGKMPLGIDNQRAEQFGINPRVAWDFAISDPNGLKVNYLFWGTRSGGIWDFEDEIAPLVNDRHGVINSQCPENLRCMAN